MNTFFNTLDGTLVELSIFTENDITDDYLAWLNDSNVMQFSNQRFLDHDVASSKKYFLSFKNTDNLFILIRTKDERKSIGTMTAYFNSNHGTVDLGILIGDSSFGTSVFSYSCCFSFYYSALYYFSSSAASYLSFSSYFNFYIN